ncbi:hypothetical protein HZB90_03795 [archaeon]|nr:hypothetical protein [archaeon]
MGDKRSSGRDSMRTLTGLPVATLLPKTARPDAGPAEEPIELSDEVADSDTGGFQHPTTLTGAEGLGSIAEAVTEAIDYKARYEQEHAARLDAEEARWNAEKDAKDAEQTVTANAQAQKGLMQQMKAYYTDQIAVLNITAENLRDQLDRHKPKKGSVIKVTPLEQQLNDAQARVSMLEQILREKFAQSEGQAAPQEGETPQGAEPAQTTSELETILELRDRTIRRQEGELGELRAKIEGRQERSSDTLTGIPTAQVFPQQATPQAVYEAALELARKNAPNEPDARTLKEKLRRAGLSDSEALNIRMAFVDYRIAAKDILKQAQEACHDADERIRDMQTAAQRLAGLERKAQELAAAEQRISGRETELTTAVEGASEETAKAEGIIRGFAARRKALDDELRTMDRKVRGALQQEAGKLTALYRNMTAVMGICSKHFLGYNGRVDNILETLNKITPWSVEGVALLFTPEYTDLLIPPLSSGNVTAGLPPEKLEELLALKGRLTMQKPESAKVLPGSEGKLGRYMIVPAAKGNKYIAYFCVTGIRPDAAGEVPQEIRAKFKEIATRVVSDVLDDHDTLYAINPEGGLKDIGERLDTLREDIIKGIR